VRPMAPPAGGQGSGYRLILTLPILGVPQTQVLQLFEASRRVGSLGVADIEVGQWVGALTIGAPVRPRVMYAHLANPSHGVCVVCAVSSNARLLPQQGLQGGASCPSPTYESPVSSFTPLESPQCPAHPTATLPGGEGEGEGVEAPSPPSLAEALLEGRRRSSAGQRGPPSHRLSASDHHRRSSGLDLEAPERVADARMAWPP
jgi:hypothetical protein